MLAIETFISSYHACCRRLYFKTRLGRKVNAAGFDSVLDKMEELKNSPEVKETFDQLYDKVSMLLMNLDESFRDLESRSQTKEEHHVEKPALQVPDEQTFSIYNIEIGDAKDKVENELGQAKGAQLMNMGCPGMLIMINTGIFNDIL